MKKTIVLITIFLCTGLINSFAGVDDLKINGDFRLRYEHTDKEDTMNRGRGRYRLRINAFSQLDENWSLGFTLASGSNNDPSSTNQSMDDNFQQKNIWLDRAFATYKKGNFEFSGGKVKNPFKTTDIIWDSDINLEGVYEKWKLCEYASATLGQMIIAENSSHSDAYLLAGQLNLNYSRVSVSFTYYDFNNYVENSLVAAGNLFENGTEYTLMDVLCEVKLTDHFTLWADYVQNSGAELTETTGDKEDTATGFGVKFSIDGWKGNIRYKNIEPNSVVGAFADATFGRADKKGIHASIEKKLNKKMSLAGSYYDYKAVVSGAGDTMVLIFDVKYKF